jgi:XTP/dITP diphosphohydrolase
MKLIFATHNQNKFKEVASMIPKHIELLSLKDIGCTEDIEETSDTIEGNALLKAKYVKENYQIDCFADDTGLEVTSLNGEPGVYSARYAGPDNEADANMSKLLSNLKGISSREAQFKTAIALTMHNSETLFFGICEGEITQSRQGDGGFGYDPIFKPNGFDKTFAEMTLAEKAEIGHRGKAMRKLINYLSE